MDVNKNELKEKVALVIEKLMNLGKPENEEEMEKNGGKEIGFFERDFGIGEWEWP